MKPGSDLAAIMNTVNSETNTLTKQDAVIVWGGIRDISRNESQKGLRQLRNFVEMHAQTNVLVAHYCFNYEVYTFNRKLGKHMKNFQHTSAIEFTSNRELFTKHGLHLNRKGKEQAAKTIVSSVKEIFKPQEKDPTKMRWKEKQDPKEATTVLSNVDKDGNQILHEDQEQKVENLTKPTGQFIAILQLNYHYQFSDKNTKCLCHRYRQYFY